MLIVFEGIDGSGKETQIRRLLRFFRQGGVKFRLRKYPTKRAREALSHLKGEKNLPAAELAGVFARDIIEDKPAMEREMQAGFVVVCDRYLHSTLAYQGVEAGFGELRRMLEGMGAPVPDLTIVLDVEAGVGAGRKAAQKAPDRFEKDVAFISKVRENYRRMEREHFLSYEYASIDSSRPEDEVFSQVVTSVEPLVAKLIKSG